MKKYSGGWHRKYAWLPFRYNRTWYWLEWYEVRNVATFNWAEASWDITLEYRKVCCYV